jgi:hypothetical protein
VHLDPSQLDGYLSRSLDRHDLRSLDDHVVGCLACTLAIETAGLAEERWERRGTLGRLVRLEQDPPNRPAELRAA